MQRTTLATAGLILGSTVLATGCVPQDKYDNLLMAYRTLEEEVVRKDDELESAYASLDLAQMTNQRKDSQLSTMQGQIGTIESALMSAEQRVDASLRDISSMEIGPLPEDVERALTNLANAYPNVLSFDAGRGMLRFASDFTFDLGSAQLRADAESSIGQLASILNSSNARDFEVRVVGHTDSVPIRRAETKRLHPTNLHLSVHRAISVGEALTNAGLAPARLQVAGHGEHRPTVAHRSGGVATNRRVEIYLSPMPTMTLGTAPAPASAAPVTRSTTPAIESNEPMK
ncbi:MAG: OmpA family protein [Planctomycetota bacterium]